MNSSTVETFPISQSERADVDRRASGDFVAVFRRVGQPDQTRWAFGSGEVGRRHATAAARQWAFGIRFDRTVAR